MKFHSDEQMEELYTKTAWFFDDKYKKPGASYEAFKHAVTYDNANNAIIQFRSIAVSYLLMKYMLYKD